MAVNDALRIACCARCVEQTKRLPLIVDAWPLERGIRVSQQSLVGQLTDRRRSCRVWSVDGNKGYFCIESLKGLFDERGEVPLDKKYLGAAVLERESDVRRVKPGVQRIEDRTKHRHGIQRFDQLGDVRGQYGDGIKPAHTELRKRAGETHTAVEQVGVSVASLAIDNRDFVGERGRSPGKKTDRRQWDEVGLSRIETRLERMPVRQGHWTPSLLSARTSALGFQIISNLLVKKSDKSWG